ncbi:MAG: diaminopimelate epimerase [Candidatus Cloacimonetes bacterium]|nr:diaminopimelate epimerase [Candidatus Cloacimonadota bacterium]
MNISFVKMHAQGNDFIIIEPNEIKLQADEYLQVAKDICDRHYGVGADGLVLLDRQKPEMKIINADGSIAEMCGSALRCCCFLIAKELGKEHIEIMTDNGLLKGQINSTNPTLITVSMGIPTMIQQSLTVDGITGDYISVGNPHFVVFGRDDDTDLFADKAKSVSESEVFENGANIEFVKVLSKYKIEVKVWERGVGETLACGTGAVAAIFSGQSRNLINDPVKVSLPGGPVSIYREGMEYYLQGEVCYICCGEYKWKA